MLHVAELALPLRRPFVTATGTLPERRTLLIGVEAEDATGWAEAAPYPGQGPGSIDQVWSIATSGEMREVMALPAVTNAIADWAARSVGEPLWRRLGGKRRVVQAGLAIGATPNTLDEVEEAVRGGYRTVKLKIRPEHDVEVVRRVRERFPALEIGVDANGSYRSETDAALDAIDRLGVAYIEQPYPAHDLTAHRSLRERVRTPVALDESIQSIDDAVAVMSSAAADLLVVKPGRLGIAQAGTIHDLAVDRGLRVKPSGLIETGIGRAFTMALATLPGSVFPDLAPADAFLEVDPVASSPALSRGTMMPPESPGIGCAPDFVVAAPFMVRSCSRPFGVPDTRSFGAR
jgi:O-succinylbenzoate synthase